MILVTGASGFVGQHLVRYLSEQGLTVRALYNNHKPTAGSSILPGITWQQCDLLDIHALEEVMEGVTHIYHCAAIVSFDPRDRDKMLHFNVESTTNLINQALDQGISKLAYVSSIAALGRSSEHQHEITEENEWEDSTYNSAYSISKYLAEMEVWRGIGEGLEAVIINPGIILGVGNWNEGSSQLITVAHREFPFFTSGVTSWVDVADVVVALYRLMNSDISGQRFIVSAENVAFKEVFTMMATALNKKPPHIKATSFMTNLVWRFNAIKSRITGRPPTITRETARNAQSRFYYNNEKLHLFLPGFKYVPIKESIAGMAQSFMHDKR